MSRSESLIEGGWDGSANRHCRVLFPGALNSEFTDRLDFIQPAELKAIPTYRVMNQYGEILDKEIGVDTTDEEALQIYKNMVKRQYNIHILQDIN